MTLVLSILGFICTAFALGGYSTAAVAAQDGAKRAALRVCEDPNNLPFSNRAGDGYENKIAELFAKELGVPVEYTWYPMQMGFARNTLKAYLPEKGRYKCDLIVGITSGFEMGATTAPYYRSTYVLVYRDDAGIGDIKTLDDLLALPESKRRALKIGVFAGSPAVNWLLRHGMLGQAVFYQAQSGSEDVTPGSILQRDLGSGKVDMTFVWGPIGGYFAKMLPAAHLHLLPLHSEPGIHFDFGISMGVRYGEHEWKKTVESLLKRNHDKIIQILRQYNVPLVDDKGHVIRTAGN